MNPGRCLALTLLVMASALSGCQGGNSKAYAWELPEGYPAPAVPADNPMSEVKVRLGRWLFFDTRLSVNGTTSCGSCHQQALSFTDGLPVSVGATGEAHPRSAMSLLNVAYASRLTWANHLLDRLEFQALTPLFGEQPVEMGMAGQEVAIVELLRSDERYAELFPVAFPRDDDPYSVLNTVRAIGSFCAQHCVVRQRIRSLHCRRRSGDVSCPATWDGTVFFRAHRVFPLPWRL